LLPGNTADLLADFGRSEFDRSAHGEASSATNEFLVSLRTSADIRRQRAEAIDEIKRIGLNEGGWSVYGAWNVLDANYLDPVPADVLDELLESRVRFLRTLDHPNLARHLNSSDMLAYQRAFPDEFARMFPDWGA
jgi:hypothetical protein